MKKNQVHKFTERVQAKPQTVHMTTDQKEIIQDMAERMNVSFEDLTMYLLHMQLSIMDQTVVEIEIQNRARRN